MKNDVENSRKGTGASSSVPEDEQKKDAAGPLAGRDDQDYSDASQQDAPVIGAEAMKRNLERTCGCQGAPFASAMGDFDVMSGTDLSRVPADTMPRSSVDVPIPQTGVPTPDERRAPEHQVPDEIRQSEQDAHQGSEEQLAEIEQKSDSRIMELEKQNEDLSSRNRELEKQNEELRSRMELDRRDPLLPVETDAAAAGQGPAVDIASLVDQARSQEKSGIEQDQKELDGHFKEMEHWRKRVNQLRDGLKATADEFGHIVTKSAEIAQTVLEQLSPETKEILNSRQKGLNLIAKMLRQQVDRAETALVVEEPKMELPTVGEQGWLDLVGKTDGSAPSPTVQRKQRDIQRKLKDAGQKRYQVITGVRDGKEKCRKNLLKFAERQLLPVLDSIDDGEEHSRQEIEALKAGNPGVAEQLETWFQTYGDLRDRLLKVLEQVQIWPMDVKIGEKIQYNHHEPFGVEPDPERENETIKSVTRNGYIYESCEGAEALDLRPAQVIVVKNEKE